MALEPLTSSGSKNIGELGDDFHTKLDIEVYLPGPWSSGDSLLHRPDLKARITSQTNTTPDSPVLIVNYSGFMTDENDSMDAYISGSDLSNTITFFGFGPMAVLKATTQQATISTITSVPKITTHVAMWNQDANGSGTFTFGGKRFIKENSVLNVPTPVVPNGSNKAIYIPPQTEISVEAVRTFPRSTDDPDTFELRSSHNDIVMLTATIELFGFEVK